MVRPFSNWMNYQPLVEHIVLRHTRLWHFGQGNINCAKKVIINVLEPQGSSVWILLLRL